MEQETTRTIRAVAFDIDGTLYSNWAMYRVTLPLVLRHLKLFRAFGKARREVRGEYPLDDLERRTAELTASHLGWSLTETRAAIRAIIYGDWEQRLSKVAPLPGARDTVLWLREQGVRTAALSDFPTEGKLRILGLDGLWDVSFSSEETHYLKPRPEPFNRLVRDLAVPRENVLYVGNSYAYDVRGADEAGLMTAHLTRRPPRESRADFSFHRYEDLRKWLERRINGTEPD